MYQPGQIWLQHYTNAPWREAAGSHVNKGYRLQKYAETWSVLSRHQHAQYIHTPFVSLSLQYIPPTHTHLDCAGICSFPTYISFRESHPEMCRASELDLIGKMSDPNPHTHPLSTLAHTFRNVYIDSKGGINWKDFNSTTTSPPICLFYLSPTKQTFIEPLAIH